MSDYTDEAQHERERHYHDLAQAEAQLHDAGLTTGDLTEAQVFAVARTLTAAVEQERRRCTQIVENEISAYRTAAAFGVDDVDATLIAIATRIAGEEETR